MPSRGHRPPTRTADPSAAACGRAGCSAPQANRGVPTRRRSSSAAQNPGCPRRRWVNTTDTRWLAVGFVRDAAIRVEVHDDSRLDKRNRGDTRPWPWLQRVSGAQTFGDPRLGEGHRVGRRCSRARQRARYSSRQVSAGAVVRRRYRCAARRTRRSRCRRTTRSETLR